MRIAAETTSQTQNSVVLKADLVSFHVRRTTVSCRAGVCAVFDMVLLLEATGCGPLQETFIVLG